MYLFNFFLLIKYFLLILFLFINNSGCSINEKIQNTLITNVIYSPIKQKEFCSFNNTKSIFILLNDSSIFFSLENPFSLVNLTQKFFSLAKTEFQMYSETLTSDSNIGKPYKLLKSPVDSSLIFVIGSLGFNWVIEDCGNNIYSIFTERTINDFVFHPTEKNWCLFSAFSLCSDYIHQPCKVVNELYFSNNLVKQYKLLKGYVVDFSWGIGNGTQIQKNIPKERILLTFENRGRDNQTDLSTWNYKVDFAFSDDFFLTTNFEIRKGNKFMYNKSYLFVSKVIDQENSEILLYIAIPDHTKYKLIPIDPRHNEYKVYSYYFNTIEEHFVYLFLNTYSIKSPFGNIYRSNYNGINFSLVLKYNIKIGNGLNDFEKIKSLKGVYIANVVNEEYINQLNTEISKLTNINSNNKPSYFDNIKTVITLNQGDTWHEIQAPKKDKNNKEIKCGQFCFLNLYSYSSNLPPILSDEEAPGIIIANGNIGRFLDYSYSKVGVFLSRNGGVNWIEIEKGPHVFAIGNHGTLLLMAKYMTPTREIQYSIDDGVTWNRINISNFDQNIEIKNIFKDNNRNKNYLNIYYISGKISQTNQHVLIYLNMEKINFPLCKTDDFEIWSPSTSLNDQNKCLMGEELIFMRKKKGKGCISKEGFKNPISTKRCDCTRLDFECDEGYIRDELTNKCIIKEEQNYLITNIPEICEGYYKISKGYVKTLGNVCINGGEFESMYIECPHTFLDKVLKYVFYCAIFILGSILCYILFKTYFDELLEKIKELLFQKKPVFSNISINTIDKNHTLPLEGNDIDDNEKKKLISSN